MLLTDSRHFQWDVVKEAMRAATELIKSHSETRQQLALVDSLAKAIDSDKCIEMLEGSAFQGALLEVRSPCPVYTDMKLLERSMSKSL